MEGNYKINDNEFIKVTQDTDAHSPDVDGNTDIFLVYDHRQFNIKRDGFEPRDIFDYINSESDSDYDNYHIFVVYAHIHGGISLSLGRNGDRFDTSSTGYILIDKAQIDEDDEKVKNYAQGIINEWNMYLQGDVYLIEHIKTVKCECCGNVEEESQDTIGGNYLNSEEDLIETVKEYFNVIITKN